MFVHLERSVRLWSVRLDPVRRGIVCLRVCCQHLTGRRRRHRPYSVCVHVRICRANKRQSRLVPNKLLMFLKLILHEHISCHNRLRLNLKTGACYMGGRRQQLQSVRVRVYLCANSSPIARSGRRWTSWALPERPARWCSKHSLGCGKKAPDRPTPRTKSNIILPPNIRNLWSNKRMPQLRHFRKLCLSYNSHIPTSSSSSGSQHWTTRQGTYTTLCVVSALRCFVVTAAVVGGSKATTASIQSVLMLLRWLVGWSVGGVGIATRAKHFRFYPS